ncbi:hypothetical protein FOE78_21835 [Microlunatus elymi]|uniref:Copper(I)-binding protein n=1 Tax=Microlunatus elymi TaxID=2596828 RepID=A0A516Q414_9ACTN|nr:hypothetical protein [Microlunatus elymi]QDP98189.1 hypothetical protein FOE78_21835 [Microlunatus elymi]
MKHIGLNPSKRNCGRTGLATSPSRSRRSRVGTRIGAAAASLTLLVGVSACGFDVQTLQHYQPSDGVDVNVGLGAGGQPVASTAKVRGLMILARTPTSGFLSATLNSTAGDELTDVTGNLLKADLSTGAPLTIKMPGPITVAPGEPTVLVNRAPIEVSGSGLPTGQTARLTLTFEKAGSRQVEVPIIDGNNRTYKNVTPSPAPSNGTV